MDSIEALVNNIICLDNQNKIQKRWANFCNKILNHELDFSDVVRVITDFIAPSYQAIVNEDEFFEKWLSLPKARGSFIGSPLAFYMDDLD